MLVAVLTDTALAVLIGGATALGAVVGGVVSVAAESWRQKAIDRRDEAREATATKVAARLVRNELHIVQIVIGTTCDTGKWGAVSYLAMPAWAEQRERLAAALDFDEWDTVRRVVAYAQSLTDQQFDSQISDEHKKSLELMKERLREASDVLAPLAGANAEATDGG